MPAIADFEKLFATPEPPELGPGPRKGVSSEAELKATMDTLLNRAALPPQNRELLRSLILLWHDHLEAAHVIAQNIENADGAFVHGIVHRREPDYGNAKYWFRRVGKHPAFPEMAKRVTELLGSAGKPDLRNRLVRGGEWDAFAFVDACEQASRHSDQEKQALRQIQEIESAVLLERFCTVGNG